MRGDGIPRCACLPLWDSSLAQKLSPLANWNWCGPLSLAPFQNVRHKRILGNGESKVSQEGRPTRYLVGL